MAKRKNEEAWVEAKKRARLNQADIQMAKELGMTPKGIIKNIPSPSQKWKAPVKYWIRDLYEDKFGKIIENKTSSSKSKKKTQEQISLNEKQLAIEIDELPNYFHEEEDYDIPVNQERKPRRVEYDDDELPF